MRTLAHHFLKNNATRSGGVKGYGMNGELIERIVAMTKCEYLSEVTYREHREQVLLAAQQLLEVEFDLSQWEYALSYVMGKDCHFDSLEEVADYLRAQLITQRQR